MNIVVCDNIKNIAMQLHKQLDQQIIDPGTNKEEMRRLLEAQQSLGGAVRFLMMAIGANVERSMSGRKE